MSIGPSFDTGALRIRLKAAEDKVKAFETGKKYVQMQEQFKAVSRRQNARIRKLEEELGKAHAQTVNVVEYNTPEFRNQTTGQRVHVAFPEA